MNINKAVDQFILNVADTSVPSEVIAKDFRRLINSGWSPGWLALSTIIAMIRRSRPEVFLEVALEKISASENDEIHLAGAQIVNESVADEAVILTLKELLFKALKRGDKPIIDTCLALNLAYTLRESVVLSLADWAMSLPDDDS